MIMRNKLPYSGKYVEITISPNCKILESCTQKDNEFARDITYSLTRKNRFIPSKYFYNSIGSQLFKQICNLPEYYIARKEIEILDSIQSELSELLVGGYVVVELGSGSAIKTRYLFDVLSKMQELIEYYPIDISNIIKNSSQKLQNKFDLKITGIVDKYENGLELVRNVNKRKIIVFFGSSIGNFDRHEMIIFLKNVYDSMNPGDLFLLGFDLVKNSAVLERAYNDTKGITKKFNLNLLQRVNDDLGGNFKISEFEHIAFYNIAKQRIEMHIRSKVNQQVYISDIGLSLNLKKDETIRSEYSYKYTVKQISRMMKTIGFNTTRMWCDDQHYFALVLLIKTNPN